MNCRVCGSNYFPNTLLSYSDMPSSAQGFPILEGLEDDAGSDLNVFQCSSCGLIELAVDVWINLDQAIARIFNPSN